MKPIGGYFELMSYKPNFGSYHDTMYPVNSGRNALRIIVEERGYKEVFVPAYCCNAVFDALKKSKVKITLYHIDKRLDPIFDFDNIKEKEDTAFLFVDFFGVKSHTILYNISIIKGVNWIIDCSHSFYLKPLSDDLLVNADYFYSPRKFLGTVNGGFSSVIPKTEPPQDFTDVKQVRHLFLRTEKTPGDGWPYYAKNEEFIAKQPVKKMSDVAKYFIASTDIKNIYQKRIENFTALNVLLHSENNIIFVDKYLACPLCYPFIQDKVSSAHIKKSLFDNDIFVPKYWSDIPEENNLNVHELNFVEDLICLPIDQRYDESDMKFIAAIIKRAML